MALSKYLKYSAYGLVGIVVTEIVYHFFVRKRNLKSIQEPDEAVISEIFFVRQPVDMNNCLTCQMKFGNERFDHHTEVLQNLILSAQRTLYVIMYVFSSKKLSEALITAHCRGVKVLLVFDSSMEHGAKNSQVHDLHFAGITVKKFFSNDHVTMHHKLCLIDVPFDERLNKLLPKINSPPKTFNVPVKLPKKNGVLIGGSLNWTGSGLTNNYEHYYVTSDANFCEKAGREFFNVWNASIPIV